jgi:hypothetical protein
MGSSDLLWMSNKREGKEEMNGLSRRLYEEF